MPDIRLRLVLIPGAIAALSVAAGCGSPSDDGVQAPALRRDALVAPAAMPELQLRELAPGVWLHTSWLALADGTPFPSNGLVVREGDHLVLIDTGWGEALTERLLDRIADTVGLPVARAIVTHAHDDRLGGAAVLQRRGIPVLAGPLTRWFASEQGLPVPDTVAGLARAGGAARVGSVEMFYPGPAHTRDNVMVWLPEHGILFGGCAVRPAATASLGNVADADTIHWPLAIERAERRYGSATLVVPSHGDVGGPELLRHTISLFPRS